MSDAVIDKTKNKLLDKWCQTSNYLSACQLYLFDNPMLESPLTHKYIQRIEFNVATSMLKYDTFVGIINLHNFQRSEST